MTDLAEPDLLPKEYVYKKVDDRELKFEVFVAENTLEGAVPSAIVYIHSGGWHSCCKE